MIPFLERLRLHLPEDIHVSDAGDGRAIVRAVRSTRSEVDDALASARTQLLGLPGLELSEVRRLPRWRDGRIEHSGTFTVKNGNVVISPGAVEGLIRQAAALALPEGMEYTPPMPTQDDPRAPFGSLETSVLIKLDNDLRTAVKAAAEKECGGNQNEWWRRAAREKLGKAAPPPAGKKKRRNPGR